MYSKKEFGFDLGTALEKYASADAIANWVHSIYMEKSLDLEDGLQPVIFKIMCMSEGKEFEIPRSELEVIAERLISGINPDGESNDA